MRRSSGISRWGSDIGGFFAIGRKLTPQLLIRWIEFGAVSPIMRTEANGVSLPPQADRPQLTDQDVLPVWRKYAKLRTQLYPYQRAADTEYRRTGMPAMRQLALVYPGDQRAGGLEDQFMFGPDLLAAPVLAAGQTERKLYLPRGRWLDFWDAVRYVKQSGSFRVDGARAIRGGTDVTVPAPLGQLPLMIGAGAVLPMLPADVDTLADYGGGEELVRLDERLDRMRLLAFPRGRSRAGFNESEFLTSREGRGLWTLRIRGKRKRSYRVEAALGTLRRPFAPGLVRVSGRELAPKAWSYDRKSKVLRLTAKLKLGRIVVSAR